MSRCECEKEGVSQSEFSPGLVGDEETILLALVDPLTFQDGSIKALRHDQLKKSQMSVVRAGYVTGPRAQELTVKVMQSSDPSRIDCGYAHALCHDIRNIKLGNAEIGAFCVIDDAYEHFPSHAHLGYSNVDDKKNDRLAARGNLLLLFKENGYFTEWNGPPFANSSS